MRYYFLAVLRLTFACLLVSPPAYAGGMPDKEFIQWIKREMRQYEVPGVSIAVIKNYKIDWAMGFGLANILTEQPVDEITLFQAGSISKPVTAMAAIKAVQDGKLTFDDDINQSLTSWKVPENQFTRTEKVTLARLLSHNAGVSVSGFYGYRTDEKLPTLIEVLDGTPPANSDPIRVIAEPGKDVMYSGGGYQIVQLALMDAYQKPFAELMDEMIFEPLGMLNSTFEQPLPASFSDKIATPYRPNEESLKGGPHIYVEQAAAGLWTTPFDLAKSTISLQESLRGDPNQILRKEYAEFMVEPDVGHRSLGFIVNVNKYGEEVKRGRYFMHQGQNEGYRSILIASIRGGDGAIIMTNMTPDGRLVMANKIKDNWNFIFRVVQRIADMEEWR